MNTDKHGSEANFQHSAFSIRYFTTSLRLCGAILLLAFIAAAQTKDFAKWVNPFIGTGGHGHTFPGATMPFGMVQLSPDTRIDNWDGSSGYHYSDDTIYGFSHTHLSGTGIPDGCDILVMPILGEAKFRLGDRERSDNEFATKFSHVNESSQPGYYSVKLDNGIKAELTATTRVGFHRYTFPNSGTSSLVFDLIWRDKALGSNAKVIGNRIEGYRRSSSWAKDQTVYFVAEISKKQNLNQISYAIGNGDRSVKESISFPVEPNEAVLVKVAISHVSIEGARKNLEAELPGWDFEKVRADAKAAWNKELSKIEVSGGTDEQTTNFYTALYHTMIQPNVFSDVDGSYLGMDKKVHVLSPGFSRPVAGMKPPKGGTQNGEHYTVFSLWDTFRAAHPLYTIIDQRRTVDFINTFIRQYEQGGRLPVWELWGEETDTMIGYHAVSVIADAMAKGIKGFDYEKAYAAAKYSAELDHFGLAAYKKRGYISMEDENESVSKTLEYAYNDWCIAKMAYIITREGFDIGGEQNEKQWEIYASDHTKYWSRSRNFENLFDNDTGFFRPKKNGGFVEPFAPNEVTFGFTEGNSWQYSFFVPHDVTRLSELMGGREKFVAKLDELFTTDQKLAGREQADLTGLIGQYAHGNEPSHHITYLYNYVGQPWKTQKYVRKIMDEFYKNAPDGLIGNEDCGQMSAWYILSAGGFYPVAPGDGVYAFGTPLFKEIKFNLENGKTFVVRAPNVSSSNLYLRSASLNGKKLISPHIVHSNIMKGGVLDLDLSPVPVEHAFTRSPLSNTGGLGFTVVPVISGGGRVFANQATITLSTKPTPTKIYYTINGRDPDRNSPLYTGPFMVDRTTTVKAFAVPSRPNAMSIERSVVAEATFVKKPNDWTAKIVSPYSTQYTGGGDQAIIDGIRGTVNFASGEWQGVQGKTYEAVVDLQRETAIKELGGSFLQVAGPWIWMPDRVEFETSNDGVNFVKAAEIKPGFSQTDMTPTAREYVQKIAPTKARYVRMRAYNFGKIPSWHLGAGGDPWIFVDEIIIR